MYAVLGLKSALNYMRGVRSKCSVVTLILLLGAMIFCFGGVRFY